MIKVECPHLDGFIIEFPSADEMKVRHEEAYQIAILEAMNDGIIPETGAHLVAKARFYGCRALCETFDGAPSEDVSEWPLKVFRWFMREVYDKNYRLAEEPPEGNGLG